MAMDLASATAVAQRYYNTSAPLTLLGWFPGVIHATFVVQNHYADERNKRLIRAVERHRGLI